MNSINKLVAKECLHTDEWICVLMDLCGAAGQNDGQWDGCFAIRVQSTTDKISQMWHSKPISYHSSV